MHSVAPVCVSVCLSVCNALNFESLDLDSLFVYLAHIHLQNLYVKLVCQGQCQGRSQEKIGLLSASGSKI